MEITTQDIKKMTKKIRSSLRNESITFCTTYGKKLLELKPRNDKIKLSFCVSFQELCNKPTAHYHALEFKRGAYILSGKEEILGYVKRISGYELLKKVSERNNLFL